MAACIIMLKVGASYPSPSAETGATGARHARPRPRGPARVPAGLGLEFVLGALRLTRLPIYALIRNHDARLKLSTLSD
jgi:hypothetical protein